MNYDNRNIAHKFCLLLSKVKVNKNKRAIKRNDTDRDECITKRYIFNKIIDNPSCDPYNYAFYMNLYSVCKTNYPFVGTRFFTWSMSENKWKKETLTGLS